MKMIRESHLKISSTQSTGPTFHWPGQAPIKKRQQTRPDLATKIRGNFRDETEGDGATAVEDEDWHSYIAFEARHRIVAERSLLANKSRGKAKPSGE